MAILPVNGGAPDAALPDIPGALRYVARQPILDLRGRVHGYELLFRAGPEAIFRGDGDLATRTMLDNTVIFGLDRLTGGLPAFVNCTEESLTEELVHVLPPSMTVLEVLESVKVTPHLIEACRKLKAWGYRLALDDFVWKDGCEPLVELADYIKVDFALSDAAERQILIKRLNKVTVALIAEKVERQEEYKRACAEGFTLFQGYYFCRPILMKNRKVPANHLSHIKILELLHRQPVDLHEVGQWVKQDASLTYRLMRLVNSPICAVRQEVRSIDAALMIVGEEMFRRIATLAITSELSANRPAEISRMSFMRGRFCELGAPHVALDPTEQYLLGMLSLLPAMLGLSMEELTPSLPLRHEIRLALEGVAGRERALLGWLEAHEHGEWAASDRVAQANGLDQEKMVECYGEAVVWAEDALRSTR
jgi:EAL and modified HD-GYP domain-containing signal transduction protein